MHSARGVWCGTLRPAATAVSLAIASLLAVSPAAAQRPDSADRTLSPYFFVEGGDPQVDRLPLKTTSATVRIVGVIADVTVTQTYRNEGVRVLEAVYVFPASTRAAVYRMVMTVGSRTITAVVRPRAQARSEYERARAQGRTATLLEQQRPNVFQMNVANIMPGDEVKVSLGYTELLVPEGGTYEFVYPTVVGPRYSNAPASREPDGERWVETPYRHQGGAPDYDLDIRVALAAGMPIREIACPSHRTTVTYETPSAATVALDPAERGGGNRDFILRYTLAGARVESGLLLYRGENGERFFLLMVEPPRRVTLRQVPPREFLFVVDVSGSMHGFPLETSKRLLADLVSHLRPADTFNVLLFSGGSRVLSEHSLPATTENVAAALQFIDREQGGGGTELIPALKRAFALPRVPGISRTVVIATDGYVAVERDAFDLIRSSLGDSNVFAFGIGTAVNRHLIEGMARAGMGEPFVVTGPEEAAARAERFRAYVSTPVLAAVHVEFSGFDAYDLEPPAVPDVLAERPVILFGRWRGRAAGRIEVRGVAGDGPFVEALDVGAVRATASNAALRDLWARHRIASLADRCRLAPDEAVAGEITALGLAYGLLTEYTSFVAIDRTVRNGGGQVETVTQPLPLPQGVSDLAVGGAAARTYAAAPALGFASAAAAQGVPGGAPGTDGAAVLGQKVREEVSVTGGLTPTAPLATTATTTGSSAAGTAAGGGTWNDLKAAARTWRLPPAPGPSTVTLTVTRTDGTPRIVALAIAGPLARRATERALRARLRETAGCLARAVAPGARLVVVLAVGPDGSVEHVTVTAVAP